MNLGRDLATALGGIGVLIGAYLILTNWMGFSAVTGSFGSLLTGTIATLQGRGGGGGGSPFGGNIGQGLGGL